MENSTVNYYVNRHEDIISKPSYWTFVYKSNRSLNNVAELWQECLNGQGKQIHQYQQNEQSPLASNHWTCDVGISGPH